MSKRTIRATLAGAAVAAFLTLAVATPSMAATGFPTPGPTPSATGTPAPAPHPQTFGQMRPHPMPQMRNLKATLVPGGPHFLSR